VYTGIRRWLISRRLRHSVPLLQAQPPLLRNVSRTPCLWLSRAHLIPHRGSAVLNALRTHPSIGRRKVLTVFEASTTYSYNAQTCTSSPSVTPIPTYGTNGSGAMAHYLGCYNSPPSPILSGDFVNSPNAMNIGGCIGYCGGGGWSYAALSGGSNCSCGNQILGTYQQVCDSGCNTPCAGITAQACGSSTLASVYQVYCGSTPYSPNADWSWSSQTFQDFTFIGCYNDGTTMPNAYAVTGYQGNTVDHSTYYCLGYGWVYTAITNVQSFYCGSTILNGAQPQCLNKNCNQPCDGNSAENCGGYNGGAMVYPNATLINMGQG
jgi:hypothetical protein